MVISIKNVCANVNMRATSCSSFTPQLAPVRSLVIVVVPKVMIEMALTDDEKYEGDCRVFSYVIVYLFDVVLK